MRRLSLVVALMAAMVVVTGVPLTASAAAPRRLALGVSMPDNRDLATLDAFTASVGGRVPAIWSLWSDWGGSGAAFPDLALMNGIRQRGAVPMFFWQPVDPTDLDDPRFTYATIIAGDHDEYIRQWAQDAKAFGGTVLLKFAHEMNAPWFPWGIGRFDNTASGFKRAWRHIHDIIRGPGGEGALNVKMVWAPYSPCGGCATYQSIWPGGKYVEYAGFSAFDWGGSRAMVTVFKSSYNAIRLITHKPIIVGETGTAQGPGDKARWIKLGYPAVYNAYPAIAAVVYFNFAPYGQPDWRLEPPASALVAYAAMLARPRYQGRIAP